MSLRDRSTAIPSLTPEMQRDLDQLDAALAGSATGPDEADLRMLVSELARQKAQPAPEWAHELDVRARAGFPRRDPGSFTTAVARVRDTFSSLALTPGLAAAGCALTALAIGLPIALHGSGQEPNRPAVPSVARGSAESRGATAAAPPSSAPAAPTPDARSAAPPTDARPLPPSDLIPGPPARPGETNRDLVPGERNRSVERSAQLTLTAPAGQIRDLADRVVALVDHYRGVIVSSQVSVSDQKTGSAQFDLRLPTSHLRDALEDLSKIAHVLARSDAGLDITGRVVDARDTLATAIATRRSLLRQLATATTPAQTAALKRRAELASRGVAAARSVVSALHQRSNYARVTLRIEADTHAAGIGHGRSALHRAFDTAVDVLVAIASALLIGFAALAPLLAIALLGAPLIRRRLRAHRERALDSDS